MDEKKTNKYRSEIGELYRSLSTLPLESPHLIVIHLEPLSSIRLLPMNKPHSFRCRSFDWSHCGPEIKSQLRTLPELPHQHLVQDLETGLYVYEILLFTSMNSKSEASSHHIEFMNV